MWLSFAKPAPIPQRKEAFAKAKAMVINMNEIHRNEINNDTPEAKKVQKSHRLDIVALVLCFIAALSIWLFVMNTNQDVIEKKIVVTVNVAEQVKNATGLDIISENPDIDYTQMTVEIVVSGTKNVLDKYDSEDFRLNIKNLDNIESGDKRTFVFDEPKMPDENMTFISMSPAYINSVLIDEVTELDVELGVSYVGGVPEGKIESLKPVNVHTMSGDITEIETIKIRGPQSIISTVKQVKVSVDVSSYTKSTLIKSKTFEFLDANDLTIKDSYIKVEPSEVYIQVIISYENKLVPINVLYTVDDGDKYKYEYTIAYKDGLSDVPALSLTGDSAYFKDSLTCDLGNITNAESYIFEIGKDKILALVPEGLSVGAETNLERVIVITITKTEMKPETPDDTNKSTDGTETEKTADTSDPDTD